MERDLLAEPRVVGTIAEVKPRFVEVLVGTSQFPAVLDYTTFELQVVVVCSKYHDTYPTLS